MNREVRGRGVVYVQSGSPRTVLEQLVWLSDRSLDEQCEAFAVRARELRERASVSPRQLSRWMAGEIQSARPAARRVAKSLWGHDFKVLVGPVDASAAALTPSRAEAEQSGWSAGQPTVVREVAMAAAESARFGQFAEQSNVGPHTLEQFRADIERIVTNYGNRPVYPTFVEVRELRNRAFELLEGRQRPEQTRDLYLVAGALCALLGEASFDLGLIPGAKTQFRTAFLCGELAGNNWLRSWVRGKQSYVAYWQDQPRVAVDLATDGWQYVPEAGTAHVQLACQEARARARLRDRRGAENALARAERARDDVQGDDDPGGELSFALAQQVSLAASTRLWLDSASDNAEAERLAAQAVELHEADPPERRQLSGLCLSRLNVAAAQLRRDDLEATAASVEPVVAVAALRPSETVNRRLRQLANTLDRPRYQNTALALDLRDQVRTATIAAPPLPAGNDP